MFLSLTRLHFGNTSRKSLNARFGEPPTAMGDWYLVLVTEHVQIETTVRDWLIIDAVLENTVSVEVVGGDGRAVELGMLIRAAGWAQAHQHARNTEGWSGWPPAEDLLEILLPATAWKFLVEQLLRWADLADRAANETGPTDDARGATFKSQARARQVAEGSLGVCAMPPGRTKPFPDLYRDNARQRLPGSRSRHLGTSARQSCVQVHHQKTSPML